MWKFALGYITSYLFHSRKNENKGILNENETEQKEGNWISFSVLIFGYFLIAAAIVFCVVLFYRLATFFELF